MFLPEYGRLTKSDSPNESGNVRSKVGVRRENGWEGPGP
jgi:hypothetical protein